MKKLTKEEFIFKAILKHGNLYNYSLVNYINNSHKIIIICKTHGNFIQRPDKHLMGHGCPECGKLKQKVDESVLKSRFLEQAKIINNNKYDYSLIKVYGNGSKLNKIICPIHGVFEQSGRVHLRGCGCPKCSFEKIKYNQSTIVDFKIKGNKKHNFKYNYDLVIYKNTLSDVLISCPEHGLFKQRVSHHLSGSGCPLCNNLVMEPKLLSKIRESFKFNSVLSQGRPVWLKRQRIDIYFRDFNIGIEYQGGQHFKVNSLHGKNAYLITVKNDERKRLLCLENGCELLYFTYKPKDVPLDYPYKVYRNEEELINKIKAIISERDKFK